MADDPVGDLEEDRGVSVAGRVAAAPGADAGVDCGRGEGFGGGGVCVGRVSGTKLRKFLGSDGGGVVRSLGSALALGIAGFSVARSASFRFAFFLGSRLVPGNLTSVGGLISTWDGRIGPLFTAFFGEGVAVALPMEKP